MSEKKLGLPECVWQATLLDNPIVIGATRGTRIIAQGGGMVPPYTRRRLAPHSRFSELGLDAPGWPTLPTEVVFGETYIGGFLGNYYEQWDIPLASLSLTQDQILTYCETQDATRLGWRWGAVFFLFRCRGEFFVARASVGDDGIVRLFPYYLSEYIGPYPDTYILSNIVVPAYGAENFRKAEYIA